MRNNTTVSEVRNESLGEMYYRIAHKSGLDIYVFPKKMSTAYALFGTRYGAIDNCFRLAGEEDFARVPDGIAHFLEHKMFENEDGSDTNEKFTRLGASANAFTSSEMTAYEFSCTENFYESLAVLLEYVTHPYYTEENIAKEQGIIGQEIGMYDDSPVWRIYYELLNLLYHKDNIRLDVCGTVESIAQITPEHLYRCYNTFYHLSNMALVVCGDVAPEEVIRVADEQLPESTEPLVIERYFEAEPDFVVGKRSTLKMDIGKTQFAIGLKDVRKKTNGREDAKHRATVGLLIDVLFGISGEFYNRLYEEGLLNNSFAAFYENSRTSAFLMLSGESDAPEAVYDRFIETMQNTRQNPPSRADFERMKRVAYASYVRSFDATDGIANSMLSAIFEGVDYLDVGNMISEITYGYFVDTFNGLFDEERCVMAILEPNEPNEEGE